MKRISLVVLAGLLAVFSGVEAWGQERIITTVAGGGASLGDGGPATAALLNQPTGIAIDGAGNIYIAENAGCRIRKVTPDGTISTIAGTGSCFSGSTADGVAALSARVCYPYGIAVDVRGNNIYFSERGYHRIRKISAEGIITTIAGTMYQGYSGDGGPAVSARFSYPSGIAILETYPEPLIYVADRGNQRIRVFPVNGTIRTVVGGGVVTSLRYPTAVDVFSSDEIYIGSSGRVLKVRGGTALTFVSGLGDVGGLVIDRGVGDEGANVYIAEADGMRLYRSRIVSISQGSTTGETTVFAGTTSSGFSGDGGPPAMAMLNNPRGVALNPDSFLYIADTGNNRIRAVLLPAYSRADLTISKTVCSVSSASGGNGLRYLLTVRNSGPSEAREVWAYDDLPSSVSYISSAASQGSCSHSGSRVTCELGTLANGAGVAIQIDVSHSEEAELGPLGTRSFVGTMLATDTDDSNNNAGVVIPCPGMAP